MAKFGFMLLAGAVCAAAAPVFGQAGGEKPAPSFRHEVVPLLTRYGCSQGACHGKLAGQNGFKLSLRGYAPEEDYEHLVLEGRGRRINHAAPGASMILLKPTNTLPHKGGRLFDEKSRAYDLLTRWIAAGTPGLIGDEPSLSHIEVLGGGQTMKVGQDAPLQVMAHFADGAVRDVTWLSKYFTNDRAVLGVSDEGVVHAQREGATVVRVHFEDRVEIVSFTVPHTDPVDPAAYAQRYNEVDSHVYAMLKDLRIPPAPLCDDATFIRRASLDVIGRLPTPDEVKAFVADSATDKRVKLVDALLARPEYVDYWSLLLGDLLQNRVERDHDVRGVKGVRNFYYWLRGQVAANRPWDQLTRDILTATGDVNEHPEVGYYIVTVGENREAQKSDVVNSVAQAFLGTRIGCAKCHNHPDERYTQDDYYHFSAFFSRISFDREKPETGTTKLVVMSQGEHDQHERIEKIEKQIAELEAKATTQQGEEADKTRKQIEQKRHEIEDAHKRIDDEQKRPVEAHQPRTGRMVGAQPLDRQPIEISPGDDPRAALAKWITDLKNENFSGSMVNRVWKHYMGVGLVEPVDDLRPSNPPTNAGLWRYLNDEFVRSGFDMKHLMRVILMSRAYQHDSTTIAQNANDRRFYSHYYTKRLDAEVLMDAIGDATGVPDRFAGYPVGLRSMQLPGPQVDAYFLDTFGRSDRVTACACEREVTLPQLLHLQNGDGVVGKIRNGDSRLAQRLKASNDHDATIRELFLATLSREPRDSELATIRQMLSEKDADAAAVLRDVFWALMNSKEFVFNH
ncbi:MAG: DUF1553 domain-containing protein [Phycisphaera sp.]|nr:DUF1553 domain-containing protein [Phycisphaera sp.]